MTKSSKMTFTTGMKKRPAKAPPKEKTSPTNIRLPAKMKALMQQAVMDEFDSSRKKSEWVRQAVNELFSIASWRDRVLDGEIAAHNDAEDTIYLSESTRQKIDGAIEEVVRYAKEMNEKETGTGYGRRDPMDQLGVNRTAIIRTAIASKLFSHSRIQVPPPPEGL